MWWEVNHKHHRIHLAASNLSLLLCTGVSICRCLNVLAQM